MLPLTALLTTQTAPTTPDAPAANGETAQNGAGFEAMLAALAQGAGQPQIAGDRTGIPPEADLPGGTILPDSGKDLPGGNTDSPVDAAAAEALPETVMLVLPPIATSASANSETAAATGQATSSAPRTLPAPPASPHPAATADQSTQTMPVLEVAAADLPKAARMLPEAARVAATARPGANLRIKLGDGVAEASTRTTGTDAMLAGTTVSSTAPAAAGQALTTPSATPAPTTVNPATAPMPLAEAAQRPQDFAQLIDRLVAAREAAAPQAASLSLAHAEFGRIDLTFASDAEGLSVNLSSPDPDFARAVQAAALPSASSGEAGPGGNRQSGQGATPQDGFGAQPQGQSSERRDGRPADRPHDPHTLPRPDRGTRETGIFA